MVSSFDIVNKIRAYLAGQENLDSFREWVVRAQLEIEDQEGKSPIEADAARLLANIEGRYVEFSAEVVPGGEPLLKRRLWALIAPAPQTAEAFLLNFFYSPSVFGSSVVSQVSAYNFNSAVNYNPRPEAEEVAA